MAEDAKNDLNATTDKDAEQAQEDLGVLQTVQGPDLDAELQPGLGEAEAAQTGEAHGNVLSNIHYGDQPEVVDGDARTATVPEGDPALDTFRDAAIEEEAQFVFETAGLENGERSGQGWNTIDADLYSSSDAQGWIDNAGAAPDPNPLTSNDDPAGAGTGEADDTPPPVPDITGNY